MSAKITLLALTRIVELIVLYFLGAWIWNNMGASYRVWVLVAVIGLYFYYAGVTLYNDYREMKYGAGEPMQ